MPQRMPSIVDTASTVTLHELLAIFRSERCEVGILDDMLIAPLERQMETIVGACRSGPLAFEPDLAHARYPEANLPSLITAVSSGKVNCVAVAAYPDAAWAARHSDEAAMPVVEFHIRNLAPTIAPKQRVSLTRSYVQPPLEAFRLPSPHQSLSAAFRAAMSNGESNPADFYRAQEQVFGALRPQPRIAETATMATVRFTSTRPNLSIPLQTSDDFAKCSLAHVVTSAPAAELLTPVEWLFTQLLASHFDGEVFTRCEPLAGITANFSLYGTRNRFGIGITPIASHAARGADELRQVA